MDVALEDIIGSRPHPRSRGRSAPRRGVSKRARHERGPGQYRSPDRHWVHDLYPEEAGRSHERETRPERGERRSGADTVLRVENIHYDITEDESLFERIGPVVKFQMHFDRSGRSEGTARVVFEDRRDARDAVEKYDGANAAGQPITVRFDRSGASRGRDREGRSLFERIGPAPPRQQRTRPLRPSRPRSGAPGRMGTPSKPASRQPKTAEQLDAELDNYFDSTEGDAPVAGDAQAGPEGDSMEVE